MAYTSWRQWMAAQSIACAHTGGLITRPCMSNPWLKKNPYLSMWLSAANAVVGTAQGHARKNAKRQAAAATRQMTQAVVDAWMAPLAAPKPRRRKRR
jgi:hypothetical protein